MSIELEDIQMDYVTLSNLHTTIAGAEHAHDEDIAELYERLRELELQNENLLLSYIRHLRSEHGYPIEKIYKNMSRILSRKRIGEICK